MGEILFFGKMGGEIFRLIKGGRRIFSGKFLPIPCLGINKMFDRFLTEAPMGINNHGITQKIYAFHASSP